MDVNRGSIAAAAASLLGLLAGPVQAASYNLNFLLSDPSFEGGGAGWLSSGHLVNANTYLTNTEATTQNWASSSPFPGYTNAFLAATYPGRPWGINPNITHINQSTVTGDVTAVIAAPAGSNFIGSRQDGYQGHCLNGGSACGSQTAYYDTNFQAYQIIVGTFNVGDTFTLTMWGNRGRLRQDWSSANTSSSLSAAVCSQSNLNNPCSSSLVQAYTGWLANGQWNAQTFTFTLGSVASSKDIRVQITGQNSGHDTFVAADIAAVPVPGAVWLLGSAVGLLGWVRRKAAT
jgi:hypothetical protein